MSEIQRAITRYADLDRIITAEQQDDGKWAVAVWWEERRISGTTFSSFKAVTDLIYRASREWEGQNLQYAIFIRPNDGPAVMERD